MNIISTRPAPDFLQVQSDKFIKLLGTVDGRDKLYKTIQHSARTAWWITNAKDPKHPSLPILASLDSTLSDARRAFRLGGFIREYKDLMANKWNPTVMGTFKFASNLGNFIGELVDMLTWLAKLRVVNINKERWEWWRNTLWMTSILYTLTDQFLLLRQTYQVYLQMKSSTNPEHQKEVAHVESKMRSFILVFLRFIADFFLCAAMLRSYSNKGYTGLFGIVSGGAGVISAWKKL